MGSRALAQISCNIWRLVNSYSLAIVYNSIVEPRHVSACLSVFLVVYVHPCVSIRFGQSSVSL